MLTDRHLQGTKAKKHSKRRKKRARKRERLGDNLGRDIVSVAGAGLMLGLLSKA